LSKQKKQKQTAIISSYFRYTEVLTYSLPVAICSLIQWEKPPFGWPPGHCLELLIVMIV